MPAVTLFRVRDVWLVCAQAWTKKPQFIFTNLAKQKTSKAAFEKAANLINKHKAKTVDWVAAQFFYRNRRDPKSLAVPSMLAEPSAYQRYRKYLQGMADGIQYAEDMVIDSTYGSFAVTCVENDVNLLGTLLISDNPQYVDMVIHASLDMLSPFFLSVWRKIYPEGLLNWKYNDETTNTQLDTADYWTDRFTDANALQKVIEQAISF